MLSKESSIAIVGRGAWGLSTALHLSWAGYTNITVYERAKIPSPYSAAYDQNKIVRAEYEDKFYTKLAFWKSLKAWSCYELHKKILNSYLQLQEAIEGWKSPLFGPYYHQTGYVVGATGSAPIKAVEHMEKALASVESDPAFAHEIRRLRSGDDFKSHTWQYSGPLTGFQGYFNRLAGYARSADALSGIWEHCVGLGVKFLQGEKAGQVVRILYEGTASTTGAGNSSTRRCTGMQTADDRVHRADLTICSLGAHATSLIPEVGAFVVARCWSVAHVQLNEREASFLRGIPTTNIRDLGFFFEPDPKTLLFKLCPLGVGYTNTAQDGISLPPADRVPPPQDFIPAEDEKKLRRLLRETLPCMANRPFVDQRLCWFADTPDSDYGLDFVPDTNNSLICLSGDSGHGFKMMPVFGAWVVDLVESGKQSEPRWRWRLRDDAAKDWGAAVSWRVGKQRELNELIEEKTRLDRARL